MISQFATDTTSNYKDSSYSSSECQTIVNFNPKFTWSDKYYLCTTSYAYGDGALSDLLLEWKQSYVKFGPSNASISGDEVKASCGKGLKLVWVDFSQACLSQPSPTNNNGAASPTITNGAAPSRSNGVINLADSGTTTTSTTRTNSPKPNEAMNIFMSFSSLINPLWIILM